MAAGCSHRGSLGVVDALSGAASFILANLMVMLESHVGTWTGCFPMLLREVAAWVPSSQGHVLST